MNGPTHLDFMFCSVCCMWFVSKRLFDNCAPFKMCSPSMTPHFLPSDIQCVWSASVPCIGRKRFRWCVTSQKTSFHIISGRNSVDYACEPLACDSHNLLIKSMAQSNTTSGGKGKACRRSGLNHSSSVLKWICSFLSTRSLNTEFWILQPELSSGIPVILDSSFIFGEQKCLNKKLLRSALE